jgi:hypothetical protein
MKDPGLEAYVEAIEAHFRARRGADHPLSPRDFALARSWHEAGVPLATVLVGIDRAFDGTGGVASLAYCRRRIEELLAARPRSGPGPVPPAETFPLPELCGVLRVVAERLEALSPGPEACFEPPLRRIREVEDLVAVAARPNWEYLRGKLREIDAAVSAAVAQALTAEDLAASRAEVARTLGRLRGRVPEASLDDAVARHAVQRGRERLGLPRVTIV